MIRTIALAITATAAAVTPALAFQGQGEEESSILERVLDRVLGAAEQTQTQSTVAQTSSGMDSLYAALAADFRADDRERDRYRHPAETLRFFQVEPNMTVAEYAPGGGWYTRVLAPYIVPQGRYLAVNADTSSRAMNAEQRARADSWPERMAANVEQWTGIPASSITAFESDEVPDGLAGNIDRILIIRSMHGLRNDNIADSELQLLRGMLADDGMVGVVQHRAPANESWARSNGTRGYLKQQDVIDLFHLNGFELVSTSEVNANPNDTANWDRGVWTLPPVLALGDENRANYLAIGESDRMTLLFRKAR